MLLDPQDVARIVALALREDLGERGDVTTDAVIDASSRCRARIVARRTLVVAGIDLARAVFTSLDREATFEVLSPDGTEVSAGSAFAIVRGRTRAILTGERTALNFLMRLCGIATATRAAVREIEHTRARLLDTRKTAPGLRVLDKHAFAAGGGTNHRMGLYDAVMIKDTHLDSGVSIGEAVARCLERGHPAERLTVEVRNLEELDLALAAGARRILLDNMDPERLRQAVARAGGRARLEASGGLRPGRLRRVAETGVDFLSVGWLTHSAEAADVALETEGDEP